jgi:hypothetical protein
VRRLTPILAVAAAVVAVAGCGSGSNASAPAATDTAAGTTAPVTTAPANTATTPTAGTTAVAGPTVTVSGPSYDKTFDVTACANAGETDLQLTGSGSGGISLAVQAKDGTGTVSITGGDEQDGVALDGVIDTLSVGDAGDISATGAFSEKSLGSSDTAFTISGSCAGAP